MGTFFQYDPDEIFNDELYEDINSDYDIHDDIIKMVIPQVGDCILYNKHTNKIYITKYTDIEKNQESAVIGIVLQENQDNTIDCIMKNFLTTELQHIPIIHIIKGNNASASAYIKQLFDRYNSKYKRTTNMEFIKTINYYIPTVAQLDYLWNNCDKIISVIEKIYDYDKAITFKNNFYNGILTTYKNKLYIWKINETSGKREIQHLIHAKSCHLLSCFTLINNLD